MSLFKRKGSSFWWVKVVVKGRRVQQSSGTTDRLRAEEFHDKLKVSLWEQERLGIKPDRVWQEAVVRYLGETSHKASQDADKSHFRWLDPHLRDASLKDIKRDCLEKLIQAKLSEGVKPSTVNRILEVVRAVLRKAANEWEWIDRAPSFRFLKEPTHRVRYLTHAEADRLVVALPLHLAAMARFGLETGLRRANVTGLLWEQVDLARRCAWIHPDQAKARKAIPVPLSAVACEVIDQQAGKHETHVFTFRGKPVTQVNTKAWRKALDRVGIENFRWHDLRHTWASWHAQSGTPLPVLQELGGWGSSEMPRRYAHFGSEHLMPYVERQAVYRSESLAGK